MDTSNLLTEKFRAYQDVKKEIRYNYKGYPVEKIIAIDLIIHIYININKKHTVKSYISAIIKHMLPVCFSTLNLEQLRFNSPNKVLFSIGLFGRKDYYEIWEFVKSQVKNKISVDFSKFNTKVRVNFKNIVRAWSMVNQTKKLNWFSKCGLAAKITHCLNVIDDLEKVAPVAIEYCAFSSVHEYETVLTYYFKKKGVKTYSLQHGALTVYKKNIPLDAITYENIVSDYHLCWGQSSKDELIEYGFNSEKLVVAGYPREVERPPLPKNLNSKRGLVLLARYSYHKVNLKLIEILKKFSAMYQVEFYLKLHPSLHWNQYWPQYKKITEENNWSIASEETTVTDLLQDSNYGWAVAVNTSAYYEAYIYNLPCLRYNDGSFEDSVDVMDDKFKNLQGLINCFKQIPFDNPDQIPDYFSDVNSKLDYSIGLNTNNYNILNEV